MQNIKFDESGKIALPICLGTMYFGSKTDKVTSENLLDKFIESGGSFIDTANIYSHWITGCRGGESELFLGEYITKKNVRDKLFISTKTGIGYPGVERGLRSNQIKLECEKSLKRLRTDYIDIYYAHADDKKTPLEETLTAFEELMREGKIRNYGASNYSAERMKNALNIGRNNNYAGFCCIQQRHSYLRPADNFKLDTQVVADESLINLCRSEGLHLLAYSPLLSGVFSPSAGRIPQFYATEKNRKRLEILKEVSGETGGTINQLVLAWMINSDPFVISVIGVSSLEQLDENLKAAEIKPGDEGMGKLNNFFYEV